MTLAADTRLVGREAELGALGRLLDGARDGHSGVLVVHGVAGVGKSALLDACAAAAPDFRVLRAEGVEAESELAFAGLHQLLRPLTLLLERLAPAQRAALEGAFGLAPPDAAGERFLAGAGALALLAEAAEEHPVLCIVDDLQWVDRRSVDALVFVSRAGSTPSRSSSWSRSATATRSRPGSAASRRSRSAA